MILSAALLILGALLAATTIQIPVARHCRIAGTTAVRRATAALDARSAAVRWCAAWCQPPLTTEISR
jgi:hypothetical protein